MTMKPYFHQIETIKKLDPSLKKQAIVLPSGSGKTNTISFFINKQKPSTFLYIVHRNIIIEQTVKIFKKVCKWLKPQDIGIVDGDTKQLDRPYIFANISTLHRDKTLERIKEKGPIEIMVIDEFHHACAYSYTKVLETLDVKYLVGLTATPFRLDQKDVLEIIDNNVAFEIDLFDGIERNILVPFHYVGLYDDIDYTKIKSNGIVYNSGDLDRALIIHKRDQAVIREYKEKVAPQHRQTIGFCNSVAHVKRLTAKFQDEGIKCESIIHTDLTEKRDSIIQRFRAGLINVLFTRDILNEGVDFPECSALMFLRPTISKTIFLQQLGRGLRKHEGKDNVLVLDFIGNYRRAFEKRNWFARFFQTAAQHGKMKKPLYEYNPRKPLVLFDSRVVKIMDIQEKFYKTYVAPYARFTDNKELLKQNFYKVKEYWKKTGKLNGQDIINNPPPGTLYYDQTISDYSLTSYDLAFGSYRTFLEEIGEIDLTSSHVNRWDSEELKDKKIKAIVEGLQAKLKRPYFTHDDWKEYNNNTTNGLSYIRHKYGSFVAFRKAFGIPNGHELICPVCGKQFLKKQQVDNPRASNTCSFKCQNIYFHHIDPQAVEFRKKEKVRKLAMTVKCAYIHCDKLFHPYWWDEKNKRLQRNKFCTKVCAGRHFHYKKTGRKEPISTEERLKLVSAAGKARWAKISKEERSVIAANLHKALREKRPHGPPVTDELRKKRSINASKRSTIKK